MGRTKEEVISIDESQLKLHADVAEILGVPQDEIEGWHINRIRKDGDIDAHIPLDQIAVAGVPTDPNTVDLLKKLFIERANGVRGIGQRDAVVIGHVPGDAAYMLDGFHRHEVQSQLNGEPLHATVEPNMTYDEVVKRRLEYARRHPEIEYARQVEWMQSVWDRSPLSKIVPNVVTAFRASQDDYGLHKTDDIELLDSLSEEVFREIQDWVEVHSIEWGYTPAEIRANLATVENFDQGLLPLIYKKQGKAPNGRITLKHVELICEAFGGEFDMQRAVVDIIIGNQLSVGRTEDFLRELEYAYPKYPQDIVKVAEGLDFRSLKSAKRPSTYRNIGATAAGRGSGEPHESSVKRDVSEALSRMRMMLPIVRSQAHIGDLSEEDVKNAMAIGVGLSETLVELGASRQGKT